MPPSSVTPTTPEQPSTLGEQHQLACALLLDYDQRARQASAGQQQQALEATWFGLQIKVGQTTVVLPQQQLAEVMAPPTITPLPGTPAWLLGLANHYGQLLPVVDLFGFIYNRCWNDMSQRRVIITDSEPRIGLMVNELGSSVRCAPPASLDSATALDAQLSRWVSNQVTLMGKPTPSLDLAPMIEAMTHWQRD